MTLKEVYLISSCKEAHKGQDVKYKTSLTSIPTTPSDVHPVFTNQFLVQKMPLDISYRLMGMSTTSELTS
jgi:hypothetical protein